MGAFAKGLSAIDAQLHNWSEEDRADAMEFAMNPINGVTAIMLYLHHRGIKGSVSSVHRWLGKIRLESDRVSKMRAVFDEFKGITPDEINAYVAATMAFIMVTLQKDIEEKGVDPRRIQALTSLAKEARSSAQAMNTPHSSASIKELELGFALSFTNKLEGIFEGDDVLLERVKNACKAVMVEIEAQY